MRRGCCIACTCTHLAELHAKVGALLRVGVGNGDVVASVQQALNAPANKRGRGGGHRE